MKLGVGLTVSRARPSGVVAVGDGGMMFSDSDGGEAMLPPRDLGCRPQASVAIDEGGSHEEVGVQG